MKVYDVYLTPDAQTDLVSIYEYIAKESSFPEVAMNYIQKLRKKCNNLATSPTRGQKRDDIRKNIRILPIDKNAVVAFEINENKQIVIILNIFYGGRDYDALITTNSGN